MIRSVVVLICLAWGACALAEPGLVAAYHDGKLNIEVIVPTPSFSLRDNESVHPQIGANFNVHYQGLIRIAKKGKYTFSGDATITVAGKRVTKDPIELAAGVVPIEIVHMRKPGPARLLIASASDDFLPEPLPAEVLSQNSDLSDVKKQAVIDRGRFILEEHNCVACHKSNAPMIGRVGLDLTNIGARAKRVWIYKWLENPKHFRAGAVMPAMLANDADRRDAATYLATLVDPKKKFTVYKPTASKQKQGAELFTSIGCANCHQGDEKIEGMGSKTTIGALAEYLERPLDIDKSGRMLSREEAVAIADHLTLSKRVEFDGTMPAGDVKRGEQLVKSAGCLNCHNVDGAKTELPKQAALDKLDPAKGCLGEAPGDVAPRYAFDAADRAALGAFIASIKSRPTIPAPAHEFSRSLARFNCIACHESDSAKPAEEIEKVPSLAGVGYKLRGEWMQRVLADKKARVRFWLKTRMPDFGTESHRIAREAVAAAGVDDAEPLIKPDAALVMSAAHLVGPNDLKANPTGMGCVTCHSIREFKPAVAADATRGPELTLTRDRLRQDFFRRWLHEPARIQPGTAMPNFFTDKSREEFDQTTAALWHYMQMGQAMPTPRGIKEKPSQILLVGEKPEIVRAQLPDSAGTITYGIAVGLPGMVNYSFDAKESIFRSTWFGGFLDMSGDWSDRGGNTVKVLGQRFYEQAIAPIRIGTVDTESPREFKGYDLKDGIPTFMYTVAGAQVRERITIAAGGNGITRNFEIDAGDKAVFFVAVDDSKVSVTASAGEFAPTQSAKSFKSTEKVPAKILQFAPANKVSFSVTIKPKN